ncbi:MAG: PEGA domain-containing protein [Lachnospiraceae bacterium]|nr:PEGA domain-containing protein [Lachnospiraceae bacterium]
MELLDTTDETIVLKSLETTRQMRFKFGLSTGFYNTRGSLASVTMFTPGHVVEIETVAGDNMLSKITLSPRVWVQEEVSNYTLDMENATLAIGSTKYRLIPETDYFSMDIPAFITDIGDNDILTITGIDKDILTVSVSSGHGFISLVNTDLFVDSLICVGDSNFELITGDMVIEVPEGTYDVTVANNGYGGTKTVSVGRNETISLDLNELKGEGPKTCSLTFRIAVDNAKIYLDGKEAASDVTMEVEYGKHALVVMADGYSTWSRTLFVNSPTAEILLDPTSSGSEDSSESSSSSKTSGTGNNDTSGSSTSSSSSTGSSAAGNTSSSSNTSSEDNDAELDYLTTISDMISTIMSE